VTIPAGGSITYAVTARASTTGTGTTLNNAATATIAGDPNLADNTGTDSDTQITDVLVTLTWDSTDIRADLDIWLVDPTGMIHSINNGSSPPNSPAGGTLSLDRNCVGAGSIPAVPYSVFEQASWTNTPPAAPYPVAGTYLVYVYINQKCGPAAGTGTVNWTLSLTKDGVTAVVDSGTLTIGAPDYIAAPTDCPGWLLQGGVTVVTPGCPPTPYNPAAGGEPAATYQFPVP
jgi:hypothetical protein